MARTKQTIRPNPRGRGTRPKKSIEKLTAKERLALREKERIKKKAAETVIPVANTKIRRWHADVRRKMESYRAQTRWDGHILRRAPGRRAIKQAIEDAAELGTIRGAEYRIKKQTEEVALWLMETELQKLMSGSVTFCYASGRKQVRADDLRRAIMVEDSLQSGCPPINAGRYAELFVNQHSSTR